MKTYGKLAVEYRKTDSLIPYARNPRRNDDAAQKLAGVIAEFGFAVPVIIRSNGEIIDGHARLKAAQILKLEEVPVIVNDEWTESQAKAFRLAVNKSAEWAEWDDELLKLELDELKLEDFDLELIGFDAPADDVNFDPGTFEEQGKLDEKAPKFVTCPHCGETFDANNA